MIAQPHDAMMSLRALHQGFSDGPLLGLHQFRHAWSDAVLQGSHRRKSICGVHKELAESRTPETPRPAEAGHEIFAGAGRSCGPLGQSQSCTSRTYQHLRPAVLTTGGAGCSSATREMPYPSTCQ